MRVSAHAVVGAIALAGSQSLSREIYDRVKPVVCAGDFGDERDAFLFRAIEDLVEDGAPLDHVTIAARAMTYGRADLVFKIHNGDPKVYFNDEVHRDAPSTEPQVAVWNAREVARAASHYRAQLEADKLAELVRGEPDAFWARLRVLHEQRAAELAGGRADELPLVRIAEIPDPGPAQWLIEQLWISNAFGIVGAEPKSWKSWLTLYLGICVASGRQAFNRFSVQQGTVMVFSAEGGKGLVRRRAAALCRAMEIEIPPDLWLIDLPVLHLDRPEVAARVVAMVEKYRPPLIILDPLRELHTGDENDAVTIASLLTPLRQLQHFGCACMVVHHLSKKTEGRSRGPQRGGQRLRGSSALHGATDSALYMETSGDGQNKRVVVTPEHRDEADGEPIKLRLRFHKLPELTVWLEVVTGEVEDEEKVEKAVAESSAKRKQILRAITASNLPGREPLKTATAIYRVVKGTKKTVFDLVRELTEEGVISHDPKTGFHFLQELP